LTDRFRTQSTVHTFVIDFPEDFPTIHADEDRLNQVLSNLLSNAVKYSPDGGLVTISGHVRKDDIVVCVQDEGPGIAPEDIPRVFDRFYRSNEASRKTKGAGLGLFLAKAVIKAHQGQIWVDEKVKHGTRICFSLPQQQTQA
jgi:signal transduction histidine kinase